MSTGKAARAAVLVGALLLLGLAMAAAAWAQSATYPGAQRPHAPSLADRLNNFGRNLFGGASAQEDSPEPWGDSDRTSRVGTTPGSPTTSGAAAARAGSVLSNPGRSTPLPSARSPITDNRWPSSQPRIGVSRAPAAASPVYPSGSGRTSPQLSSSAGAARIAKPAASSGGIRFDDSEIAEPSEDEGLMPRHGSMTGVPSGSAAKPPASRPLHERLSSFRDSTFRLEPPRAQTDTDEGEAGASDAEANTPSSTNGPTGAHPQRVMISRPGLPSAANTGSTLIAPPPGVVRSVEQPESAAAPRGVIVPLREPRQRITLSARPDGAAPELSVPAVSGPATLAAGSSGGFGDPAASAVAGLSGGSGGELGGVLMTRKGPVLAVKTTGPRKILVGRESAYEILIHNSGEVAAEDLVVYITLPPWADVLGAEASTGATQVSGSADAPAPFLWKLGQLPAGGRERLSLRIVPRESRPFDLAVRWEYKPVASQAMIEVQEPKLEMALEGPRDVLFGKREVYTLKLANTGTGDAENVVITLQPLGPGDGQPASHPLGALPAGQQRAIEVEMTPRQAGELTIQLSARADGGARAELVEKVLVRRAALALAVAGPQVQFVGAEAVYAIRVSNPGNAPARNIRLDAAIPPGAKYVAGIDSAQVNAGATRVQWTIDSLNPGAEQVFEMRCHLGSAGANRLEVLASAADDLSAVGSAITSVEAMADLALEVKDPVGPVAVGQEALYEVHVRNRGTKSAEGVEVVAFFSNGVEPIGAEGGLYRINPGQVAFSPIVAIGPGEQITLKIRAKAGAPGSHVFRAEVLCKPLGTRLVSEETTHFYAADGRPASQLGASGDTTARAASPSALPGGPVPMGRAAPAPVQAVAPYAASPSGVAPIRAPGAVGAPTGMPSAVAPSAIAPPTGAPPSVAAPAGPPSVVVPSPRPGVATPHTAERSVAPPR